MKLWMFLNLPHVLVKYNCSGASLQFNNCNTFYHSVSHGVQQQYFLISSSSGYSAFIVTCHLINYSKEALNINTKLWNSETQSVESDSPQSTHNFFSFLAAVFIDMKIIKTCWIILSVKTYYPLVYSVWFRHHNFLYTFRSAQRVVSICFGESDENKINNQNIALGNWLVNLHNAKHEHPRLN